MNTSNSTTEKKTLFGQTYSNLYVVCCDQKKPPVGCGYYYLVQSFACMAHTAFRYKHELKRWMKERGLKVGRRGGFCSFKIEGSYFDGCEMMNTKEFFATYGHLKPIRVLSNGDYVIGFTDNAGNVYHQNPNTDRIELEYFGAKDALQDTNKDHSNWRDKQFNEFVQTLLKTYL